MGQAPPRGVMKDEALVKTFRKINVDVTWAMGALTLFNCHQQFACGLRA
jgi:hypothetical protein